MTDNEHQALAWYGQQVQRTLHLARVPFIVLGIAAMPPVFLAVARALLDEVGRHAYEFAAFVALAPAVLGLAVGIAAAPSVLAWRRPRLLAQAAQRFGLQREWLDRNVIG